MPCLNPNAKSCSRYENLKNKTIKPINSSINVYLKIKNNASFISSLFSASNILLAFFSYVTDIFLPKIRKIIEEIVIIPSPPA